jgi:hypothetical protein
MFTIGIFTTHLPYIAFVVFYAFFLLFGVNKASSGEIQWGESSIILKAPAEEIAEAEFCRFFQISITKKERVSFHREPLIFLFLKKIFNTLLFIRKTSGNVTFHRLCSAVPLRFYHSLLLPCRLKIYTAPQVFERFLPKFQAWLFHCFINHVH